MKRLIVIAACLVAAGLLWGQGDPNYNLNENPNGGFAQPAQWVKVTNWPDEQNIGGAVEVTNLPAVQSVSGTVQVENLPLDPDGAIRVSTAEGDCGSSSLTALMVDNIVMPATGEYVSEPIDLLLYFGGRVLVVATLEFNGNQHSLINTRWTVDESQTIGYDAEGFDVQTYHNSVAENSDAQIEDVMGRYMRIRIRGDNNPGTLSVWIMAVR